jgi:hypothetical protein
VDLPDVSGLPRKALGSLVGAPSAAARLPELVERAVDRLISIDVGLERVEESLGLLSILPELAKALERVDRHVIGLGESVDGLERRLKTLGRTVAPLEAGLKRLDEDLKTLDGTVGRVQATTAEIRGDVGRVQPDVAEIGGQAIGRLVLRLDQLHATLEGLRESVENPDATPAPTD